MFSSAGYFRSANCPFFIHGLCHRPYCHFRHAKPGHGSATKSTVKSCLKTKVPATKTDSGDKTSPPSKAKDTVEASPKSSLSLPNHEPGSATTSDIQSQNKAAPAEPQATKPKEPAKKQVQKTPQSKSLSILESLNKLEAAVEEASASLHTHYSSKKLSDVINIKKRSTVKEKSLANENDKSIGKDKKEKTFTDEDKISSNKKEKLSTNKTENSITSDKEKTFLDKKKEKNSLPDKNTDKNEEKSIVKDKISETTDIKTKDDKSNASRVGCNQNIKDISTKISNESELPSKQELQIATEKSSLHKENSSEKHDLNTETSKPYNKDVDNNVTEFEFNITEDLMEQVHDKTHHKTVDNAKRKLDLDEESIHVAAKRRKSSTGSDELSKKVDKSEKKNHENSSTTLDSEKDRLKRKKLHEKDSMKKQITENSTKKSKESSEKEKSSISLKFKKLDKVADPNSDKKSKTKRELQDIDFFLSPKKSKTKSQEKEKPDQSSSSTGKHKTIASDDVKLKTLRKHMTPRTPKSNESKSTKNRNETSTLNKGNAQSSKTKSSHTVETINSLFESDEEIGFSSDSFSDSEPETAESGTDTLKEIFDNYDPKKEGVKRQLSESVASTSGVTAAEVSPAKDRTGSTSEMQGLGKKRRVAHNPTYLIQRKASNINPVRRLPKATTSIPATPPKPTPDTNAIHTKKRLAHVPKPTTQTSLARPRIPLEYGAKVPQNLRQRYLDKIIDENLRLYATEKEAFDKGVEEERSIYERATRRPMYLNLCCNAVKVLRSKPTPEFQHDPTPYGIASTSTPIITGSASKESPSLKKIDVANLTGEMTYELLSQYMLNEEQLVDNGYPRHCPSTPGKVTFKPRRPLPTPSKDPNRRTCCRCGRRYTVREDGSYVMPEECVYHVGRLFRRRIAGEITSSYQCCGGDASTPGCAVCKYHVCEGKNTTDGFMTTIISPLAGNQKKVFGVDCEMCYTTAGLELTRVTVVDWKLDKVYDTFVKPDNPILDYNTRFSGVTQECLRGVKTSIREVQAVLLSMISKDSILVGHSLESDLLSLKLVHSTVVDTSVVFPHRLGPPYKRALRTLMAEFVKKIIQNNEEGHDSYEDAKASLELMLFKVKEDLKKKPKPKR